MIPEFNKSAQIKIAQRLREMWDAHSVELPRPGGWNFGRTLPPARVDEFVQSAEQLAQLVLSLANHEGWETLPRDTN